jgi:hypothetical protein
VGKFCRPRPLGIIHSPGYGEAGGKQWMEKNTKNAISENWISKFKSGWINISQVFLSGEISPDSWERSLVMEQRIGLKLWDLYTN